MSIRICRFFTTAFLLYNMWILQVWGANQIMLYGTVGLAVAFMAFDLVQMRFFAISHINYMVKMYVIFGIYALLTGVFVASEMSAFLSEIFTYACFVLVAFMIWYISYRINDIRWILDTLYYLAALCAVTTIFWGQDYRTEVVVTTMGPNNNPNTLGVLMVLGIFSIVFMKEELNKHFIIRYTSIMGFLYTILICGSRKALFAGIGLFACWLISYFKEVLKERMTAKSVFIITSLAASLVFGGVYVARVYVGTTGFERLLLFFSESGMDDRTYLYSLAVEFWMKSPLIGIGFSQFKVHNPLGYYSHSIYAEVLSCTGLLGCVVFFVPIIKLLIMSIRNAVKVTAENQYKMWICLLMLGIELFLGLGQIYIYSMAHLIMLVIISNIVYDEIPISVSPKNVIRIRFL